jgi:hypothetical protein
VAGDADASGGSTAIRMTQVQDPIPEARHSREEV